jgi:solute carrier family 25 S-adenosylmethionine transporter 26
MSLTAGGWNGEKILMRQVDMPQIPFTITQFPLYEHFKKVLARRFPGEKGDGEATAVHSALAGSIGGGVASLVTQPVDVVRTRIMLEAKVRSRWDSLGPILTISRLMDVLHQPRQKSHADPLQSLQSTSLYPRIVDLYKNEGLAALFKGTGPRTGAVMVAGGIYLGLYDAAKMWVGVDR